MVTRLIDAAVQVITDDPAQLLKRGLRVEDVLTQADAANATFFRKFKTKDDFITELLEALIDETPSAPVDVRAVVTSELDRQRGDVRRCVTSLIRSYLGDGNENTELTRRLLAMVFGRSSKPAIERAYSRRDRTALHAFEALLPHPGVEYRAPFTAAGLGVALTAIVDGFLIRHQADPDSVSAELLANVLLIVAGVAWSAADDHSHIDDVLEVFDAPPPEHPASVANPRQGLIATARREFDSRGYYGASFERIATAAGIPVDVARRLFPTKEHIIVGALRSEYTQLAEAVADDVTVGADEVTVLRNHFLRCARLVQREMVFMDALMTVVAHDTYAESRGKNAIKEELHFPSLITDVIEQGQRAGRFNGTLAAGEIAAVVTNTLLLRCFTRRSAAPEDNADSVSAVVLEGILAR